MKIVIDIQEEVYKSIQDNDYCGISNGDMYNAIKNGTPLPKGHGRLKDIDKIMSDGISKGFCDWYDEMKYADTIIEADKAEREEEE